ncbi:hypothetical protein F4808DRAFT_72014 [Astrocystis sublimbata]|nr:hypothetical protein F4808DRAFT_72014 [Astrocystis sublimbata]
MPYIDVDKWESIQRRDDTYNQETKYLKNHVSNHHKFLERHMPVTLDEYCNPSLSKDILDTRNRDQVLGRYEARRLNDILNSSTRDQDVRQHEEWQDTTPSQGSKQRHKKLLGELWILIRAKMRESGQFFVDRISRKPQPDESSTTIANPTNVVLVRQAWVWKFGKAVIMTGVPDTRWFNPLDPNYDPNWRITTNLSFIVTSLDNPTRGADGSLLRTYENALIYISEEVKMYTKSARVEDIDLDKEKDLFHQISDLREEVSMIESVLTEQEEVWNKFVSLVWQDTGSDQQKGLHRNTEDNLNEADLDLEDQRKEIWETQAKFDKYKRRIRKLQQDAERVEKNITTMLDLKQKHATIREAHSTAVLSATVFGFTIITVIFAPLAFVMALFAFPIDRFNEGKEGNQPDGVYSTNYIGKWSAVAELVSIFVTMLAMWAGLRFAGLHVWGRKGLREYISRKANAILAEEESRKAESKEKEAKEKRKFWADWKSSMEQITETGAEEQRLKDESGTRSGRSLRRRLMFGALQGDNDAEKGVAEPKTSL